MTRMWDSSGFSIARALVSFDIRVASSVLEAKVETLQSKSSSLHQCVAEMIGVFVEAVAKWEAEALQGASE